ncbi:MAG: hypothetical protein LQ348_004097 [Seirophora lacunosa]|nr:MAG: hypothetical protein LQ348_004097 [Seirophora lacunosa]
MSRIEVTLYQILADCTLHAKHVLHSSTTHEDNTYYLYEPDPIDPHSGIHVSPTLETRPHAAALHVGPDSIQLEACGPSVYMKTSAWIAAPSKQSYTRLSSSAPPRQILYNLRPDEMFKIGDSEFILRPNLIPLERNVQVESSRPEDVNDNGEMKTRGSTSLPHSRPETPHPASGPTVMETPVTTRYAFQQVEAEAPSHSTSVPPSSIQAGFSRAAESPCEKRESALKDDINRQQLDHLPHSPGKDVTTTSNLPEAKASSNQGGFQSSESTEASSQGSSVVRPPPVNGELTPKELTRGPRMSKKRSASPDQTSEQPDIGSAVVVDLESAPGVEENDFQAPATKRQRLGIGHRSTRDAAGESQNSIRSTIHVEAPDIARSTPHPVTDASSLPEVAENEKLSKSSQSLSEELDGLSPRIDPKSTEPPSSIISTRSTGRVEQGQQSSQNQITRIYYSSSSTVKDSAAYTKFLRQHNIKQVKNAADCDVLCTGKGELKRTSNLILTVLRGKAVVTDQWVIQSATSKKLLGTADFIPESPARTREWGTSLGDAIDRGRRGLKPLRGWTINFTPSLKRELGKSWSELKDVCLAAGVDAVQAMIPKKTPKELGSTVVVAATHDPDETALEERGWKMFHKEIITYSVLRGELDADSDEFLMKITKKGGAKGRKNK